MALANELSKFYKVDLYDPLIEEKINIKKNIKKIIKIKKKYDSIILGVKHKFFFKKNFLKNLLKKNKNLLFFYFNNFISVNQKKNKIFKKAKVFHLT